MKVTVKDKIYVLWSFQFVGDFFKKMKFKI
jgi:hypothetical protein